MKVGLNHFHSYGCNDFLWGRRAKWEHSSSPILNHPQLIQALLLFIGMIFQLDSSNCFFFNKIFQFIFFLFLQASFKSQIQSEEIKSDVKKERKSVPIFALHPKGSHYIPLSVTEEVIQPYLHLFDQGSELPLMLHPITISVNFCGPIRIAAGVRSAAHISHQAVSHRTSQGMYVTYIMLKITTGKIQIFYQILISSCKFIMPKTLK